MEPTLFTGGSTWLVVGALEGGALFVAAVSGVSDGEGAAAGALVEADTALVAVVAIGACVALAPPAGS